MISEAVHNAIMTRGVSLSGLSGAYVCEYFNKSEILNLLEAIMTRGVSLSGLSGAYVCEYFNKSEILNLLEPIMLNV